MITRAMVLGAGFGTRLGVLTQVSPKPLIKVGECSILFRILDALEMRGITHVIVNTHYLAEQMHAAIREWLSQSTGAMRVEVSHEIELLDIGGGMKRVSSIFGDNPFLVVNGDIVWQEARHPLIQSLMDAYDEDKMDALMSLSPTESGVHLRTEGDVHMDAFGHVAFKESQLVLTHVYMGLQIVHPRLLSELPDGPSFLRPAWLSAEKNRRVYGAEYTHPWADMGTLEGLNYAQELVQSNTSDAQKVCI